MKSSFFIDPRQKCPNCHSDQYIRSVRPFTLHSILWSRTEEEEEEEEEEIIVKCLQCDEILHKFRKKIDKK